MDENPAGRRVEAEGGSSHGALPPPGLDPRDLTSVAEGPCAERDQHVFLMCHREADNAVGEADTASELAAALERSGYQVSWSTNAVESKRLLERIRPSVAVLDPLVCVADGVEFEMVERLQTKEDPVPLIVLVDDHGQLPEVRRVQVPFKDFLVRPFSREELVHRIEQSLLAKERYLTLQVRARQLEGEVIRDFKTGLYTERHFRHLLRQEFQRAERHRTPLSFLLLDIDDFKSINDSCDYSFGDLVLTQFAALLHRSIRDIDHAARFGGDEFMVLLPNTSQAEAVQVAGRIRGQLERQVFDNGRYQAAVTTSIGIDTYDGRGMSSPEDLRRRANVALKEAKGRGKNKIWLYAGAEGGKAGGGRSAGPADQGLQNEQQ